VSAQVAGRCRADGVDIVVLKGIVVEIGNGPRGQEQVVMIRRAAGKESQPPHNIRDSKPQTFGIEFVGREDVICPDHHVAQATRRTKRGLHHHAGTLAQTIALPGPVDLTLGLNGNISDRTRLHDNAPLVDRVGHMQFAFAQLRGDPDPPEILRNDREILIALTSQPHFEKLTIRGFFDDDLAGCSLGPPMVITAREPDFLVEPVQCGGVGHSEVDSKQSVQGQGGLL
jgi:hypothetical protein